MGSLNYDLYLDDSGSRYPDHYPAPGGEKNAFGLGGIILSSEDSEYLTKALDQIALDFSILGPFQSSKIRAAQGEFFWLKTDPVKASEFYRALDNLVIKMPAFVTGCIIDRTGYNERYKGVYGHNRWHLSRTAYSIVAERAAKFAIQNNHKLRIYIERTGRKEDSEIVRYHRDLIDTGMPFDSGASADYEPLSSEDFQGALLRNPRFFTKELRLGQLADLMLYPLVAGGYNENYRIYQLLKDNGKLLEIATSNGKTLSGVKYSCFDE